jgi:hypothetical protein
MAAPAAGARGVLGTSSSPRTSSRERGYPPLTELAKRKILGGNLARLHGIDPDVKAKELGAPV